MTYTLDLVGFSIVFPVLAPLLLNPHLRFFASETPDALRTTILGLLFAAFGIAQFFGAPLVGALADHYGRYKSFLYTIGFSVVGYAIMAFGVYFESLGGLFVGRLMTGLCSGNFGLAQSATADLTDEKHRGRAFGILLGCGGLGFVAGPWFGGKLANPDWLSGSGAFIFAAIAALLNFIMVFFFFVETWRPKKRESSFWKSFKDIRLVFHTKALKTVFTSNLVFSTGWAFFLIFNPMYLVQKFSLSSSTIGDFFAYMALVWFFVSMVLNKELSRNFSARTLTLLGFAAAFIGVGAFVIPDTLWPYWIVIPIAMFGGALAWINLSTLISLSSPAHLQGRALGASGSMWSIGQVIASLIAGPLAGWNIYSPLLLGAALIFCTFIYLLMQYQES